MVMHLMITDDGPHSAADWANVTADHIIQIASTAPEALMREAQEFRGKLVELLEGHHGAVQAAERSLLENRGGASRLKSAATDDVQEHALDDMADEIVTLAKPYSFGEHFARAETRAYVRDVLANHFATSMHIERSWHADKNPDTPEAKAFRATHYPEA